MVELLVPAGSLEKLKYGVVYGADAVYLGFGEYSLRANSKNFNLDQIKKGIEFAHKARVKVYAAVNIFAHNRHFLGLDDYINSLLEAGIDAFIVADPGIFRQVKRIAPNTSIHISTQANITNLNSALFWQELGAKRITLARELTLKEIADICAGLTIKTEVFVHGAMCLSYSGRCYLSKYLTGRDANLGDCAQSCRWEYYLMEQKRPGSYMPIFEDRRETFIMSSKDLMLARFIPDLINAGVKSFKIEGRMKSLHYVAAVTKVYRQIIDDYQKDPQLFKLDAKLEEELFKISHRQYHEGFLFGSPQQVDGLTSYYKTADFVGAVLYCDDKNTVIEVKNKLESGNVLDVLVPDGSNFDIKIGKMKELKSGSEIKIAHANYKVQIKGNLPQYSLLRKKNE